MTTPVPPSTDRPTGLAPAPAPGLASTLRDAAHAAAGAQQYPAGALYVVATPIGNLADLSLRAIEVLSRADAVACEDRRVSGALLRHLGLNKPLVLADQHHERAGAQAVLARLAAGERVALVTDAGTPALSDPGARLVGAVAAAGHRVVPVPGPSAVLAALSVAGPAGDGFRFVGFLPAQGAARQAGVQRLADDRSAAILFEAPHRVAALADALAERCGSRRLTVVREATKQFEQVLTLPAADWPAWLAADADRRRGEFVLVLHADPAPIASPGDAALDATLRILLADLSVRQSAQIAARLHAVPRDAAYARALALRDGEGPAQASASAPDDPGPAEEPAAPGADS